MVADMNDITMASKRAQQSPADLPGLSQLKGISVHHPQAHCTTLLKAVDYNSMGQLLYDTNDEKDDAINLPFSAGPVTEVLSFSIYKNNSPTWEDFGMYGNIGLTDYLGNTYFVYKSQQECPEHVFEDRGLALPHSPLAPAMGPKVKFSLTDVDDSDNKIFRDDIEYYLDGSLECGQQVTQCFDGESDYVARMVFKKIPLAVIVVLDFYIQLPAAFLEGCTNIDLTKTFTVSGFIKVNNIVCWESSESENMTYGMGAAFEQFRTAFPIPLGTLIDVYISWETSCGIQFEKSCKIEPKYFVTPTIVYYLTDEDEDYACWFRMSTVSHNEFFYSMEGYLHMERNPQINQVYPLGSSKDGLVEVFSILIYGGSDSPVSPQLCGQIVVQDQQGKVYIFARNNDCPDTCLSNEHRFKRTLSLAWPDDKWFIGKDFYMHLKLKDVDDNHVCNGMFILQQEDEQLDRRMCKIILGDNGYFAAVHYSLFVNGRKAKVSVKCSSKGSDPYFLVYGSIFAEYDNYDDYRSTYDKECYRNIIFKRTEEECLKVLSGSEIPLSKSRVSGPSDCKSLSVHVDLHVCLRAYRSYKPAVVKLVFEADIDQSKSCGEHVVVEIQWFS